MAIYQCRYFNGYKPCRFSENECNSSCSKMSIPESRVLVIHLEALGAVLRTTSILPAIKRKFKNCHITWVTQSPAQNLLKNNPLIDRVYTTDSNDLLELRNLKFDFTFCVDKSLKATGICKIVEPGRIFGFRSSGEGAILPATPAAMELWKLGLSNYLKFKVNSKPETQLMIEALELGKYVFDEYIVELDSKEKLLVEQRRSGWAGKDELIVGLNTGCSLTIPYKKMSVQSHRSLINKLAQIPKIKIVLLGGPEDTERNSLIAQGLNVECSPTESGLRDGLVSTAACDLIFSGDSLGMHMAIALKKYVVAWFGPTCAHEIELYKRGEAINSQVECGPCWKRSCHKKIMCYDLVNLDEIVLSINRGILWQTSSYKQPFSEICS